MKYTIIEDCSPYYIRFTHDGVDTVVEKCLNVLETCEYNFNDSGPHPGFLHYKPSVDACADIHASVPMNEELDLQQDRAAMFITKPGYYYRCHKDGYQRYSLNYTVKILDDACVTSWYSDEECAHYEIDPMPNKNSRECVGFDKSKHTPLKRMIAVQGEVILFNTDIFHDWDNSQSDNIRIVMTLRDYRAQTVFFEQARKRLFGY